MYNNITLICHHILKYCAQLNTAGVTGWIKSLPLWCRCPCGCASETPSGCVTTQTCGWCDPSRDCVVSNPSSSFHGSALDCWLPRWRDWNGNNDKSARGWDDVFDVHSQSVTTLFPRQSLNALTVVSPGRCRRRRPCWWEWEGSASGDCGNEEGWCLPGQEKQSDGKKLLYRFCSVCIHFFQTRNMGCRAISLFIHVHIYVVQSYC